MRVGFDIGGVLSKYPHKFRDLAIKLQHVGVEIVVITDMPDHQKVCDLLAANDFDFIPASNVYCADYNKHGDGCKVELLRELEVDLFFDDHLGYMAIPCDTIRCLVMPDPHKPYYNEFWKIPEPKKELAFGRRIYKKP